MKLSLLFAGIIAVSPLAAFADNSPQNAAIEGLQILKALAAAKPSDYGFSSAAELQSATLGQEFPVYFIGLSDLAKYSAGQDAAALASDIHSSMFLVTANGSARCFLRVELRQGVWKLGSIEGGPYAAQFDKIATQFSGIADAGLSILEIPALHQYLLWSRGGRMPASMRGRTAVYSPYDDQDTGLKAGQYISLEKLVLKLGPKARAMMHAPATGPGN